MWKMILESDKDNSSTIEQRKNIIKIGEAIGLHMENDLGWYMSPSDVRRCKRRYNKDRFRFSQDSKYGKKCMNLIQKWKIDCVHVVSRDNVKMVYNNGSSYIPIKKLYHLLRTMYNIHSSEKQVGRIQ